MVYAQLHMKYAQFWIWTYWLLAFLSIQQIKFEWYNSKAISNLNTPTLLFVFVGRLLRLTLIFSREKNLVPLKPSITLLITISSTKLLTHFTKHQFIWNSEIPLLFTKKFTK